MIEDGSCKGKQNKQINNAMIEDGSCKGKQNKQINNAAAACARSIAF
jgi:hypothetical protein